MKKSFLTYMALVFTVFIFSLIFLSPLTIIADTSDSDLSSEVQTVRATYGSTISHEQASKILDTVAWNHKDEGWGLLSKPGGNHCPLGSIFIACDILFNKNSGNIYDVFSSGPGICNDVSVTGKAGLSWNLAGQGDMSLWTEPINPVLLSEGVGDDVVLPDNTVCKGDASSGFPPQPNLAPPTQGLPTDLGQLIQQIFTWSLGILGIAIFVMFFYSGFLYLTAAGNTARTGNAKSHMTNAVFGAILLLSAYLILYTINPDFVKSTVNLPGLDSITGGAGTKKVNNSATCDSGFVRYGNKKAGEICHFDALIPGSGIPPETECAGPNLACRNLKCQISGNACQTHSDCLLWENRSNLQDFCGGTCQQACSTNVNSIPGVNQ